MDSNAWCPSKPHVLSELGIESPCDVILLALQCLRSGNYEQALALCSAGQRAFGSEPAVSVVSAMAELGLGNAANAEALLASVRNTRPGHLVARYTSAWLHAESGNKARAVEELVAVIGVYPDYPGALSTLSSFLMPGPSYRDVLGYVHQALNPKTYLEIGVETGATLRLAQTAQCIVGVDPNLSGVKRNELNDRVHLYATTSDEFFAVHTLADAFGGRPLDLAFIDGMHRFEYAVRDFCNVELWSNADTVVIIHDVLPVLPIVAERERQTKFWVGDVWKALWLLVEARMDLTIRVIPTPPSGLAVIRGLNRAHKWDPGYVGNAVERYAGLAYPSLGPGVLPRHFRVVANSKSGWNSALGLSENPS